MTLQTYHTLPDCIRIAELAHFKQEDRGGFPYIDHPKRVLAAIQQQGAPPYVQMAAVLHDVTEDTKFTPEILLAIGVPEPAVNLVALVDRDISEAIFISLGNPKPDRRLNGGRNFFAWCDARDDFYYAEIKKDPYATILKRSDIGDNRLQIGRAHV